MSASGRYSAYIYHHIPSHRLYCMDIDDDDMQVSTVHTTYKMTHIVEQDTLHYFVYSIKKLIRH